MNPCLAIYFFMQWLSYDCLTHWGRDEMNNISQTTFLNAFSSMEMFEFRLKFHWSLFPRVQFTIFQPWFRWWLGAVQATSHYLNQWWIVYRRINASLGLNELTRHSLCLSSVPCIQQVDLSFDMSLEKLMKQTQTLNALRPELNQHWFRKYPGARQTISFYRNQLWWSSLLRSRIYASTGHSLLTDFSGSEDLSRCAVWSW